MRKPLDGAVKARVRAVLDGRAATEAELRKLFEDGRACSLILSGELEHTERRLGELSGDPASSLVEIAVAVRRANELRPDLEELHALLAELEERARACRGAWLAGARPSDRVSAGSHRRGDPAADYGEVARRPRTELETT
jgi:hypothetical protein